ncbi:SusC/RagA family protein, partial [Bacteroides fragilis]
KTKSGQSGKPRVTYSGNVRFSDATNIPEMLDSYTFAQYFNRAAANDNGGTVFSKEQLERIKAYQDGTLKSSATFNEQSRRWNYYTGSNANTDWFKEVYEDWVPSMDHNLSISGGTDKTQYIVSGSFLDQKGLIRHGKDTFQRYTLNGRITSNITDWFTLGYSTKWTREDYDRPSYLTGLFFHNVARRWPTVPVYDDNGYLTEPSELIQLEDGGRQINQKDLFTQQLQLTFEPIKNWKIYVEGSLRVTANNQHWEVLPVYQHDVDGNPVGMTWDAGVGSYPVGGSKVSEYAYKENYYSTNIYSDYFKQLDNGHYFKAMVGFNAELYKDRSVSADKSTLITPSVPTINTAVGEPSVAGGYRHTSVAGFFARLNWNYKDRYMLEANGRYDGSSR